MKSHPTIWHSGGGTQTVFHSLTSMINVE